MEDNKIEVCRVCLNFNAVEIKCMSIYDEYRDSRISDYINAIAEVQIREDDGLPDRICTSCFGELEQAVQFKHKCERSHSILTSKSTVNEPKEKLVNEDVTAIKQEPEVENSIDGPMIPTDDPFDSEQCEDNQDLLPVTRKSRAIDLHLQCDDCKEFFKTKCKLKTHWKRIHLMDKLKCTDCKRQFSTYKAYNKHKKATVKNRCKYFAQFRIEGQGKKRVFYCKQCKFITHQISSVVIHCRTHTDERPHKCEICLRGFKQQIGLITHREYTHRELFEEVPCPVCGKCIRGPRKMQVHIKTHSEKNIPCTLCDKKFGSLKYLRVHMLRHQGEKTKTCETCAMSFFTLAELYNHKRYMHNYKIAKCDFCEFSTKSKYLMKQHLNKHNSGKFVCKMCCRFFESQQELELHQKTHERTFPCKYCDIKFHKKRSVYSHIKRKHKHERFADSDPPPKKIIRHKKPKEDIDKDYLSEDSD